MKLTLGNLAMPLEQLEERFWGKVQLASDDACWNWTGWKSSHGYGQIRGVFPTGKFNLRAPRIAYELAHGEIPDGMLVCHTCDNRLCVNPAHLWLGSVQDNARDMSDKKRGRGQQQTHCKHGHEFTPENTYYRTCGYRSRQCRACNLEANRRMNERKAAA